MRASLLTVLLLCLASPTSAQLWYASPELGWSEVRGPVLGARFGAEVVAGLDIVVQGLHFFPGEKGVAEPGVEVDRSSWQASGNALYVFDRTRSFAPYVGVGLRYGRAHLTLVRDGLRASQLRSGFGTNFLGGVRFPRLPGHPFVELRGGDEVWTLTGGILWSPGRR